MSLVVVRNLRRVKQLRANRAEQDLVRARACATQAENALAAGRQALRHWIEDMPRRTDAIYADAVGQVLDRDGLDALAARVVALRERRQALELRCKEQEAAVQAARAALEAAARAAALAQRALRKFDELVDTLQRAAVLEAERREDAELEEAAERRGEDGSAADPPAGTAEHEDEFHAAA